MDAYERRFTFIAPLQWNNAATGLKKADENLATNTKLVGPVQLNINGQIAAINEAIISNVDGIITAASEDSEELRSIITKAISKGIPVVFIDSDLPDSDRISYIGTNNVRAGQIAGQDMYNATSGCANIGIVVSTLDSPNQRERVEGFKEEISKHESMKILEILECHSDGLELMEKIPGILEKHPEMNGLFLTEAYSSYMVGGILKSLHITSDRLKVVAFDDIPSVLSFIQDGTYYSTVAQSQYMFGYLAVETLCEILDGYATDDIIYTDVHSIRRDNFDERNRYPNEEWQWYSY